MVQMMMQRTGHLLLPLARAPLLQRAVVRRDNLPSSFALQWIRRVQTHQSPSAATANAGATAAETTTVADGEAPKYKPGWFSRNPGITLGAIFLGIGLYIYRGTRNKKNFDAVQTPIAEEAVISPYEAWELRSSNNILPEAFEAVRDGVMRAFPTRKAAMEHFDQYLGVKLVDTCPNGLSKAHQLERVLMSLERDENKKCDIDALLVAFSMAVKGGVNERLQCLFNLATSAPLSQVKDVQERKITQPELERLLELLLNTYQIPSEKRVLEVAEEKFPFQQYKTANAHDLLEAAVQAQVDAKKVTAAEANARTSYTFEEFSEIMRGKTVCLWGECFANSKKRMKN